MQPWQQQRQAVQQANLAAKLGRENQVAAQKRKSTLQNQYSASQQCPSCGIQNRPDAHFCERCGAPLSQRDQVLIPSAPWRRSGFGRVLKTLFWLVVLSVVLYGAYVLILAHTFVQ
jgi:hypothetical protein